jgi:hypothetical protein
MNPIKELATLEFTDRESYIAWRKAWRDRYATLSEEIRELRKQMKGPGYHATEQSLRELKRKVARMAMEVRGNSKIKADAQWREAHPERQVPVPQAVALQASIAA